MAVLETDPVRPGAETSRHRRSRRLGSIESVAIVLIAVVLARDWLVALTGSPRLLTLLTLFASIMVQALPFLVLGTVLSAAVTAFVPVRVFHRALNGPAGTAVPVAALAGMALPAGEQAATPVAGELLRRGVAPAPALAFALAAPGISPVVLISTAVAFPGEPALVAARALASVVAAIALGYLWLGIGRPEWLNPVRRPQPRAEAGWAGFWESTRHHLIGGGGLLVVAAFAVALLNVTVPADWLQAIADSPVFAVLALALLAVLLSIRAEVDAFVAAALTPFSLTARLAFLVVGPAVDLRAFAGQVSAFGPQLAARLAPATLVVAGVTAVLTGWWLL